MSESGQTRDNPLHKTLFILWFVATCSDAISSLIAGLKVRQKRGRYPQVLSHALFAIALEASIAAISLLLFYQTEAQVAPLFALCRVVGRTVKSVFVWKLALWLLNIINGGYATETEVAEMSGALPPEFWRKEFRLAIRTTIKDEFLK